MTIRELLKDIYDIMMKSREVKEAEFDNLTSRNEVAETTARYEAAEEMLRQVFKKLHEAGVLAVDMALIRELKKNNEDIHSNRKSD